MSTQNRNRKRGKDVEREVAKMFGGMRVGSLGYEDVQHDIFSIEVKSRVKFAAYKFMEQAIANNPNKGTKVPIVVVHRKNHPHKDNMVMINIEDFLDLVKEIEDGRRRQDSE